MIDYRIKTFLKLCETMNYTATAKSLNMTQPAVTQQIHYLENEYNCKLFFYNGRKLTKTLEAEKLEQHSRELIYNEKEFVAQLNRKPVEMFNIGATRTIGDFVIPDYVATLLKNEDIILNLTVENTQKLLEKVQNGSLDFAIIEGFFDRSYYGYRLMKKEKFTGICSKYHPFAGKSVKIEDLFSQTIILRESGSGTREIFEQLLYSNNYSLKSFKRIHTVNSFQIIKKLISENDGISFAYSAASEDDDKIGRFSVEGTDISGEFNYVYLKNSIAINKIDDFEKLCKSI